MGLGSAIRSLYPHGLGRDNDMNVVEVLTRNAELKSSLFEGLLPLFSPEPFLSIDQLCEKFCAKFAETKQLFMPPHFEEDEIFKIIPCNSKLPFLQEMELNKRPSSYARLYKFRIHPEFCSPALSKIDLVRKQVRVNIDADRERNVLEFFQKKHPNLIRLHFAYSCDSYLNLVFTFFPMDLRQVLRENSQPASPVEAQVSRRPQGSILDSWLWTNLKGVIEALLHIYEPDTHIIGAHFDLKPANILVDASGNLVVTDFGLTRIKAKAQDGHTSLTTSGGDSSYRPPPPKSPARYNRKYDIWSLACIMIEIIVYLRRGENAVNEFAQALENDDNTETRSQNFWKQNQGRYTLKKCVKDLLKKLQDPNDQYLKEVGEWLQKMLDIDPEGRPAATEVKTLFAQTPDSASVLQVCGANTQYPLKKMQISMQMEQSGPYIACDLGWLIEGGEVSLTTNYTLNDGTFNQTFTSESVQTNTSTKD
ncbi:hypothetical protein MMC22_005059 [Lobaria immixta]|nr:hypothetical protein [Lobaria immixta]